MARGVFFSIAGHGTWREREQGPCWIPFLASHSEVEWIMPAQEMPETHVVFGDSGWGLSASQGLVNNSIHIPSISAARRNTSLHSTAKRQHCMRQDARQLEDFSRRLLARSRPEAQTGSAHGQHRSDRVRHLDVRWLWTAGSCPGGGDSR